MKRFQEYILGIPVKETTFARRGFRAGNPRVQQRLEKIGRTFVHGYNSALHTDDTVELAERLAGTEVEFRGFAFEGAAMALTLLDHITFWRRDRLQTFLSGIGKDHSYMAHVGAGWALARLGRRVEPFLSQLDPLLGWLAIDGYGFHEGYFHWRRYFESQAIPRKLSGYALQVFDQGLGRSLWFVSCADVVRIPAIISAFEKSRRADLWSGIGLACAYAGGAEQAAIEALKQRADTYIPQLAQGAAFAAKARQRAANPATHTNTACEVLCGLSAVEAATITDFALEGLSNNSASPLYEIWRQRIQAYFAKEVALV